MTLQEVLPRLSVWQCEKKPRINAQNEHAWYISLACAICSDPVQQNFGSRDVPIFEEFTSGVVKDENSFCSNGSLGESHPPDTAVPFPCLPQCWLSLPSSRRCPGADTIIAQRGPATCQPRVGRPRGRGTFRPRVAPARLCFIQGFSFGGILLEK